MPSAAKLLAGASGVPTDPNFRNVTLLLHGDGSNGAQNNTFVDSSTNNFTITRNGNPTQGSFSPYGSRWSNYFDGNGDYLSIADNAAFDLAAQDWTIETWVNFAAYPALNFGSSFIWQWTDSTNGWGSSLINDAGTYKLMFSYSTTGTDQNNFLANWTPDLNAWYHVALTRSGNNFRMFVNGTQLGTTQTLSATIFNSTSSVWVGARYTSGAPRNLLTGYLADLRVVKGTAIYTSNFTPPIAPLTAITNTSLLTCQSNRFRDASTNNFAITRNGDVRVTPFSPYAPTAPYSTATNGGSAYFDGSGDYLSRTASTATQVGSSSFTTEAWFYLNNRSTNQYVYCQQDANVTSSANLSYGILILSDGTLYAVVASGVNRFDISSGAGAVQAGCWNHVAIVRNGNVFTLYLNGIAVSTNTQSITLNSSALDYVGVYINIGSSEYAYINGYISDFRIVKGTAVYTANFTPPTAPVTAITNTSLLLNGTNAAIFDSAADNDLETVGNAQISTSVKKFGTGSIAFDGIGSGNAGYLRSNSVPSDIHAFSSGDFTIEMWININASQISGTSVFYDSRPSGVNGAYPCLYYSGGTIRYYVSSVDRITSSTVATGTWHHVAVSRSGSSTKMFINGTQAGSTYTDTTVYLNPAQRPIIGGSGSSLGNDALAGYIDDLRITNGVARYTANFTPPTAAFPDQ